VAAPSRSGLARVVDPATRQVVQILQDRVSQLEAQLLALQATVLKTGSPIDAYGQRIENLAQPQGPNDAVNLSTLRRYVQTAVATLRVAPESEAVPGVPGTPNTIPSTALPLYDGTAIVQAVFAANPDFVTRSCQLAAGGTWELMDAIVDALRAVDTRFGYNGKRGNPNDPSLDAIAYDFGTVAGGEGATSVYVIDVIAGHCGVDPQPAWQDVTLLAPGVWISRGRF
jgi:hypothetical protein